MRSSCTFTGKPARWCLRLCILCAILPRDISAHETDQYSVPVGRQFADLRFYFSDYFREALERATAKINARIEQTLVDGKPTASTEKLYNPSELAWGVLLEFPPVIHFVETLEMKLHSPQLARKYPGFVVAYKPAIWIYHHPMLLLDFTKLVRLARTSTIVIDGVHLGTDKLAHFVHMGYLYFSTWHLQVSAGRTDKEGVAAALGMGTGAHPFSEASMLGMLPTGVWSNADLAADYCGYKFFRNLTEAVSLHGKKYPPLLVRHGAYWGLNQHVRKGADFFSPFVSDHWDEVLNPNKYVVGAGTWVCESIRSRCESVLHWYGDSQGRPRSRDEFVKIATLLSNYFGEAYGHDGNPAEMVGVATCCFDKEGARLDRQSPDQPKSVEKELDTYRRTSLWHAADQGSLDRVRKYVELGTDPEAPDIDGETALHRAVIGGHCNIVEFLMDRGADAAKPDRNGITPLHHGARGESSCLSALLRNKTSPDPPDMFGRTPLHDAAERGNVQAAILLSSKGASVRAVDKSGNQPLHLAARSGHFACVHLLIERGAPRNVANRMNRLPKDEAKLRGHDRIAGFLHGGILDPTTSAISP